MTAPIQGNLTIIIGDNPNTRRNDGGSININQDGTATVLGRIPLNKIREALAEEGYTLGELVSSQGKTRTFSITAAPADSIAGEEAADTATVSPQVSVTAEEPVDTAIISPQANVPAQEPVDTVTISPQAGTPAEPEAPAPNADESVMNPTQQAPAGPVASRNSVFAKVESAFKIYLVNSPTNQSITHLYSWDGIPEHPATISEGCPYGFQSELVNILQGFGLTVITP